MRLVTATGPPGVGKTRLAIELARTVMPRFGHGAAWVPLADVADPALVPSAVGRALGVRELGARPLAERLERVLAELELLLVLDNLEHLLAAGPFVARLLAAAPRLEVLVTSRAPLRLSGEQEFPLSPLEVPGLDELGGSPVRLARYPAIALFVERARAVDPAFKLTEANAAAVRDVCARLDGVPLAIELAAARVKILSPRSMLDRLEHPLELLTSGPSDLPARQRTLRGTIEWSFGLLDEDERRLLARLAVFAGGCTPEQVEALVGALGGDPGGVLTTLGTLLDHNLLRRFENERGEVRLAMLETIRELAVERLRESGEEAEAREAHAALFLALADEAERVLAGRDEQLWLDRLEAEHDNFRATLRRLVGVDPDRALALAAALSRFWQSHGHLTEGRDWLARALSAAGAGEPAIRSKAMNGAALLAFYQADYAAAAELADRALSLAREAAAEREAAAALLTVGLVQRTRGEHATARATLEQALAACRALGDARLVAEALSRLGNLHWFEGRPEKARPLLEESLAVSRELGDRAAVDATLQELAWVALSMGEDARAQALHEEAAAAFRRLGDRWRLGRGQLGLGLLATARGDFAAARGSLLEALAIFEELGDRLLLSGCLVACGVVAAADRKPREGARLLAAADALRAAIGATWPADFSDRYWDGIAATESALRPEELEAARAEGGAWTLDDALAHVRDQAARAAPAAEASDLTARELEVLRFVAEGLTDAEAAERLVVSVRTVHAHLRSIYRKLDVSSRSAATRVALERGLAHPRPR